MASDAPVGGFDFDLCKRNAFLMRFLADDQGAGGYGAQLPGQKGFRRLIRHGHRHASALLQQDDLTQLVRDHTKPGDMVVCLGAGTISAWANALPARLRQV